MQVGRNIQSTDIYIQSDLNKQNYSECFTSISINYSACILTCEDDFFCIIDCVDKFESAHDNCPCQDHCQGGCPCEYYTCSDIETTEAPTEPPITETTTTTELITTTIEATTTTTGLPDDCRMLLTDETQIAEGTKLDTVEFGLNYELSFELNYKGDSDLRGYRNIIHGTQPSYVL